MSAQLSTVTLVDGGTITFARGSWLVNEAPNGYVAGGKIFRVLDLTNSYQDIPELSVKSVNYGPTINRLTQTEADL